MLKVTISQMTLTIFVGVVAHYTICGIDNGVPQLPQTVKVLWLGDYSLEWDCFMFESHKLVLF